MCNPLARGLAAAAWARANRSQCHRPSLLRAAAARMAAARAAARVAVAVAVAVVAVAVAVDLLEAKAAG